jgi:MFS family permease
MTPFNYIPLWAVFNGTTMTKANVYLSICNSGSVVGRIASGWLADRLGHFNILAISCCLAGIVTAVWIKMDTDESMGAFAFLCGLFYGASAPLVPSCITEISSDMSTVGLRLSAVMAMCSVSTVGGGPAAGAVFDKARHGYVGYLAVFLFSGIATLTGGIVLFVVGLVWVPVNRLFGHRASSK